MNIVQQHSYGVVTQTYDIDSGLCIDQEFVQANISEWEDEAGGAIDKPYGVVSCPTIMMDPLEVRLVSDRGKPLAMSRTIDVAHPKLMPIITVELYIKWYDLYVVQAGGIAYKFDAAFPGVWDTVERKFDGSAYCDHVFNPKFVGELAGAIGGIVDDLAYELMIGRWEQEYKENYLEVYQIDGES